MEGNAVGASTVNNGEIIDFVLRCMKIAHDTYQIPLQWNNRKKTFTLDESKKYKQISLLILLMDIAFIFNSWGLAYVNYKANLNPILTIALVSSGLILWHNVSLDVNTIWQKKNLQQHMNLLMLIFTSKQGNLCSV